jgi:hypothetical protein
VVVLAPLLLVCSWPKVLFHSRASAAVMYVMLEA